MTENADKQFAENPEVAEKAFRHRIRKLQAMNAPEPVAYHCFVAT